MSRWPRRLASVPLAALAVLAIAASTSAHPLGNYTVNRAVAVEIAAGSISVTYIVDMAEIPAFSELEAIDGNADGQADAAERAHYARTACAVDLAALALAVDGAPASLVVAGEPSLSFPAGAGGLETLRLVCRFAAARSLAAGSHDLAVADRTDDGHVGWREVTISAGSGVVIASADVPAESRSLGLTRYPVDALQTPPDVRRGTATFRVSGDASAGAAAPAIPAAPSQRGTANDPLAALISGRGGAPVALLAVLLALGLGAAHAVSPGHGKTLVAAYLIGSSGSARQAAALGLTVAATHTLGVFLLGAVTLFAGQLLVPERVIAWLTVGSGVLVVLLGVGLVVRAARARRSGGGHEHGDEHDHHHDPDHHHEDAHDDQGHRHPRNAPTLRPRNVVALGLAGGMVPSSSALIVLLVALTTNQLLFGLGLIVAFGTGMALVLGGLALATTLARSRMATPGGLLSHTRIRGVSGFLPIVSGVAVLVAGLAVTIGAMTRIG